MTQRVFVTGGSGFVGRAVVDELLRRIIAVNALVRERDLGEPSSNVKIVRGDVFDPTVVESGLDGCDAVIHLVGIIRETPSKGATFEHVHVDATRVVAEAAARAGVKRYLHMSALGTRPDAASTYHQTKYAAEQVVRSTSLDWTILRPSMIHGPGGEFMKMEAGWAKGKALPFLFMPYFGTGVLGLGGAGKLQPVYVHDVARAFVEALDNPKTVGRTYALAGTEVLSWPGLHHAASEMIAGKRRRAVAIPAWYARGLARVLPGSLLPFNRDQVIMALEDGTADLAEFTADFGWTPRPFRETLAEYVERVR